LRSLWQIQLNGAPITLPAPLRDAAALILDAATDRWLFPGQKAGHPMHPSHLARRLRALGVPVAPARVCGSDPGHCGTASVPCWSFRGSVPQPAGPGPQGATMPKRTFTEAERQARREADRQPTREAVQALRASEGWQNWLRLRHHFHGFSLSNQLLIAASMPEATRIAGSGRGSTKRCRTRREKDSADEAAPRGKASIWRPFVARPRGFEPLTCR
jgi:hypothetical protein